MNRSPVLGPDSTGAANHSLRANEKQGEALPGAHKKRIFPIRRGWAKLPERKKVVSSKKKLFSSPSPREREAETHLVDYLERIPFLCLSLREG